MSRDWYNTGLKFECQGCGKCCRGPGGYVWVTPQEIEAFAKRLEVTSKDFMKKYVRNVKGRLSLIDNYREDCIFMTDGCGCEYYNERPNQCKTFPWWPELLVSKQVWDSNEYECPGINIGKLYSAIEINEQLKLK